MIPGTTIDSFKALEAVVTHVEIDVVADKNTLACGTTSKCEFRYQWAYTPIIYRLQPPVVYPGQTATLVIDPKGAPNYKKSTDMAIDVKIDGELLDFEDLLGMDDTLSKNMVNYVRGRVTNTKRSKTAPLTAW